MSEAFGDLLAARKDIDAASALVKQAALRANPKVDASLSKTVTGTDNTTLRQGPTAAPATYAGDWN